MCDPRSQFATPERFPDADEVIVAWPEEAFARIGGIDRATYIAVLTHDPKLDDAALSIALQSEAAYVVRWAAGVHRRSAASGCSPPGSTRRCSSAWPRRLVSISARSAPRRRRSRSCPRWWRSGMAATAGACPSPPAGFTRWALDRWPRPCGGRRHALRRAQAVAELDGRPLLEHALRAMTAAPVGRVVVVLGALVEEVTATVDFHGAEPRTCERWDEGLAASLACGLAGLADCEAVVVTLGDQPRMSPDAIRRVIDARDGEAAAVRATYLGEPGHPVLLERELFESFRNVSGDHGARTSCSAWQSATSHATTWAAARTWIHPPS